MKTRFNLLSGKTAIVASAIATAGLVLTPVTGYALEANKTGDSSAFCKGLSARAGTMTTQVAKMNDKVADAWAKQDQKVATNDQKIDQDIAADRKKADTDRTNDFAKLEAKATTDAQKQAVQSFEASVRSALTTRRTAYDAARKSFREGVRDAVVAHRTEVRGQINQFKASTDAAISTAEASCASTPTNGQEIRQTLQASLKSARQTFQAARKDDAKVGSQVKQLAQTRITAYRAADQAFHVSMVAARDTLKQAFNGSKASV